MTVANPSRPRQLDLAPTAAWSLKLGGLSLAALTGVYLWPALQKVGEDGGAFGLPGNRFGPAWELLQMLLGNAVIWTAVGSTAAAAVGFFYGRWLQGAMRADGPDSRFKITSPAEASAALDLPVLGHTFRLDRWDDPRELLQEPQSTYSEELNRIASCAQRWLAPSGGRIIAITSDRPGTGKSQLAVGLSVSLAAFGKRVLVIDGDLRNPSLHRWASISNARGFTDVAMKREQPSAAIQGTEWANLDIMTTGPMPPTPASIVASSGVASWIRDLLTDYDFIFIDTAPLAFSEVMQFVDISDGMIYVVEHGSNLRQSKTVLDQVRRMSDKPSTVVMSKIPPKRGAEAWAGYGYAYFYGYEESDPTSKA